MDSREYIKKVKAKSVFVALKNTRLTGCTIENCEQVGDCILQFNSYEEKLNYENGKKECCGCVTISG